MEFEFIIKTAPDKETIKQMHKELAKGLVNKYGQGVMKEVLKQIDK